MHNFCPTLSVNPKGQCAKNSCILCTHFPHSFTSVKSPRRHNSHTLLLSSLFIALGYLDVIFWICFSLFIYIHLLLNNKERKKERKGSNNDCKRGCRSRILRTYRSTTNQMRGMGCGDRCMPFYLRRAKDLAAHTTRTCTTYPGSCKHYPVTFLLHAEREKMTPWVRASRGRISRLFERRRRWYNKWDEKGKKNILSCCVLRRQDSNLHLRGLLAFLFTELLGTRFFPVGMLKYKASSMNGDALKIVYRIFQFMPK